MPIKHSFTSSVPDGGDASLVRPSDWNAVHVETYTPGAFTLSDGQFAVMVKRLALTGSQRGTLLGTSRLRIT